MGTEDRRNNFTRYAGKRQVSCVVRHKGQVSSGLICEEKRGDNYFEIGRGRKIGRTQNVDKRIEKNRQTGENSLKCMGEEKLYSDGS